MSSLFIILDTILIKKSPFIKEAIFSDVILVSNYHIYEEERIKLIPDHMINIIYKTVTPSFEKLQIIQNLNSLLFQVILIFSVWILIKVPPILSAVLGNRFSKKYCLREWIVSICLRYDDKNLVESFECGKGVGMEGGRGGYE